MSIKKHTTYNLLGRLIPLGLSLITIPIYIDAIGEARYGILAIAWLLLGYFGLFDLGLGRATAQRIASLEKASAQNLSTTFWTALIMNAGLGVIGGIIIWPVATYYFGNTFDIQTSLQKELSGALPWMVIAVPLITITGVLTGALQGRSRFLELNIISTASSALTQLLPLAIAWLHGPSLAWLLPAVVVSRFITSIVLFSRCKIHIFANFRPTFSFPLAKNLLKFGGWVTISSIVGPLMVILDRLVIGSALGAKSVAFYTVPFQVAEKSTILASSVAAALFPRFAAANEQERIRLAVDTLRLLSVITTPVILFSILWVNQLISWWISPEFATHAMLTAEILLVGFWANGLARVPAALLQAAGKPHVVAVSHMIELLPYLTVLFFSMYYWGLPGAALAFGLRTLADGVILSWAAGTLWYSFLHLLMPSFLILSGVLAIFLQNSQIILWGEIKLLLPIFSIAWSWLSAPKKYREAVIYNIKKRISLSDGA